MLFWGFICKKRRPDPGRMGSSQGREGYLLGPGRSSGLSRAETHHCAVKSTNSGEKRSAGSWGDGSSTTCFSCWKGVPQDSYGNRRMAISICNGDSSIGSETPTLCTRKQSLQRSCLSWSSILSWTVRLVKGLTGDISPKMRAKRTEELVLLSQPAKTTAHGTNSTLSFDWLGYQVFKQSEFRRFCIKTQVPVNLEKSEGW